MSILRTRRSGTSVAIAGIIVATSVWFARWIQASDTIVEPSVTGRSAASDPVLSHVDSEASAGRAVIGSTGTTVVARGPATTPLVADVTSHAVRSGTQIVVDPFGPIRSPDEGPHCAPGLGSIDLTAFFSRPVGGFQGGDYQRAIRLPDDRVLWTFQDAFIDGVLVHNAALVQSGRCFTLLNAGTRTWLFDADTIDLRRWHWILGGDLTRDDAALVVFVVEMIETGSHYLSRTRPARVRRVSLDSQTLTPFDVREESVTGEDLYGWSVTSDDRFTYLYSHCYRQFGFDGHLGFDACVENVKVARLPRGEFEATREYWNGSDWSLDHRLAAPILDRTFVMSGNNPAQIRFDGTRFVLVEKRDDWFGRTIEFGVSERPTGPFVHLGSTPQPTACAPSTCTTYFASWVPWRDTTGEMIWSISRNVWDGALTGIQLDRYRPVFGSFPAGAG